MYFLGFLKDSCVCVVEELCCERFVFVHLFAHVAVLCLFLTLSLSISAAFFVMLRLACLVVVVLPIHTFFFVLFGQRFV